MPVDTLQDLLVAQLKDIYGAEKQMVTALPRMARTAVHDSLAEAFQSHLNESDGQLARLEQVFDLLAVSSRGSRSQCMEGLLEEGAELMAGEGAGLVIDAGMITTARRMEHYEIAAYTATIAVADALHRDEIVRLLSLNLEEERSADERFGTIAFSEINPAAVAWTAEMLANPSQTPFD